MLRLVNVSPAHPIRGIFPGCVRVDETGAPMKVRQEVMRHASIETTMKVYGQAMSRSKREANGNVVKMALKPLRANV